MEDRAYPTQIQEDIEKRVTNYVGFKDSPKDWAIKSGEVNTFLNLRIYLSFMEMNTIKTKDINGFYRTKHYSDQLRIIERQEKESDLINTQEDIEKAIKRSQEARARAFQRPLCAVT